MMELDFLNQTLAEEVRLVFGEVHIIVVTKRAVHDRQRMECEIRQLHRVWVDPSYRTCCLKTETCLVGKAHREVIRVTGICEALHLVNRAAQVVTAV